MSLKLDEKRYIVHGGWVGLENRHWLKVVPQTKWWPWSKPKYKIEMIIADHRETFESEAKAIEFAKHILWCWVELIKR